MAQIIQFPLQPNHTYATVTCAGCHIALTDDYWEIELPNSSNEITHIGLCDKCNDAAEALGIF